MSIISGDILQIKLGIICHQVNCMGKMGAGIALKIRNKWPTVYQDYIDASKNQKLKLGEVILSTVIPNQLYVANLCGQYYYGRNKKQTDYNAVRECLIKVNSMGHEKGLKVYIPKNMGCALAGGDWYVVSKIIEEVFSHVTIIDYGK